MPFKNFFRVTATFPIVSPPFVVALSAILLFGRAGTLNPFLTKIIGDYTIYGLGGLILVETIAYAPTAFLVLYGILQAIDPSLEEASMDLGASRAKVFSTITLPLSTPGIASAWLLVFIQSLADFGNPMVISGNYRVLSAVATPIAGIIGIFISFLLIRKKFIGRGVMEFISMLTFAVPGTVVGIGYILAFNQKTVLLPFIMTGTAWIIIILLVFRNMPVGIRSGIAALQQIDPSIEEASTDLGADSNTTFRRITLPMIAPAFFSGLAYNFVKAMTAISAVIFVVSGKWNLITIAILGFVDNSRYAQAAAMSNLLIIIVLIALGVIQLIVNRIGKGVRTIDIIG